MSTGYLIMWPSDRVDRLKKHGEIGLPLKVLFGSPHGSAPSMRRYGIGPGDALFVVFVRKGDVYLLSRLVVGDLISVEAFVRDCLGVGKDDLELHPWDLWVKLAKDRPDLGQLQPWGCVDEAAVPASSTPARTDQAIPSDLLARLRFVTKRKEVRALPLVDGKLKKVVALQGHFHRLDEASREELDRLLSATP